MALGSESYGAWPVQFDLVVNLDSYTQMIIGLFIAGPPEGCDPLLN